MTKLNRMKFSFILPAYNIESYVEECIQNIAIQCESATDMADYEIIIVNDGSTDSTGEIVADLAKYNDKLIVLNQKNSGLSKTRNVGMDAASGNYILFVDGDDFIRLGTLYGLMNFCSKVHSDLVVFGANSYDGINEHSFFTVDNLTIADNSEPLNGLKQMLHSDYSFGWCVWHYVFRHEFLRESGLRFIDGRISEDVDFTLRVLVAAKTISCYKGDAVYNYRVTNTSSISHLAKFSFVYDLAYFIEQNINILEELHDSELIALLKLNYQTLIGVILFWYSSYLPEQRKKLIHRLKNLTPIYEIPLNYKSLYKRKERIVQILVKLLGFHVVGMLWGIKRAKATTVGIYLL